MKINSVEDARANLRDIIDKMKHNEPVDYEVLMEARMALHRLYLGQNLSDGVSLRDCIEMAFDEFR